MPTNEETRLGKSRGGKARLPGPPTEGRKIGDNPFRYIRPLPYLKELSLRVPVVDGDISGNTTEMTQIEKIIFSC